MTEIPLEISSLERDIIQGLQFVTQVLRVPLLGYFIYLTNKFIRCTDENDTLSSYSKLTFIFLSTQLFFQTSGGILDFLCLTSWGVDRLANLLYALRLTRTGVFFSQNMALSFNIGRWLLVI